MHLPAYGSKFEFRGAHILIDHRRYIQDQRVRDGFVPAHFVPRAAARITVLPSALASISLLAADF